MSVTGSFSASGGTTDGGSANVLAPVPANVPAPTFTPPAGSTAVGNTAAAAAVDYNNPHNVKFGSIFTPTASGESVDIRFYAQGGTASQSYTSAVYAVTAGVPGALVATGVPVTVAATQLAGWFSCPLTVPVTVNVPLMLAVVKAAPIGADDSAGAQEYYTPNVVNGSMYGPNAGGAVPDATFGTPGTAPSQWLIALDVMPPPPPTGVSVPPAELYAVEAAQAAVVTDESQLAKDEAVEAADVAALPTE